MGFSPPGDASGPSGATAKELTYDLKIGGFRAETIESIYLCGESRPGFPAVILPLFWPVVRGLTCRKWRQVYGHGRGFSGMCPGGPVPAKPGLPVYVPAFSGQSCGAGALSRNE